MAERGGREEDERETVGRDIFSCQKSIHQTKRNEKGKERLFPNVHLRKKRGEVCFLFLSPLSPFPPVKTLGMCEEKEEQEDV